MKMMNDSATSTSRKYTKRSHSAEVWRRIIRNPSAVFGMIVLLILVLCMVYSFIFIDYEQVTAMNASERFMAPCLKHPFGTDDLGRDLLLRTLYGTRYSLAVGFGAIFLALVVGVILGALAGYFGGLFDDLLMRASDILASIPPTLLGMVIVTVLGQSLTNLLIAVGVTTVPIFMRITRASVMTVSGNEFVESARAIGMSNVRIIFTQVLPNGLSPIIVMATSRVGQAIIEAAGLSFLGFGVPVPTPEWGALISAGRNYIKLAPYISLFPGLFIMITVLACNLLGDGLRDALDPKLKK